MDSDEEVIWEDGYRRGIIGIMRAAVRNLGGYENARESAWIIEREETISMLRRVCEEHGDNDWENDLYLPDIIENHLERYLPDKEEDDDEAL